MKLELITKYLEVEPSLMSAEKEYALAVEKYIALAAESGCFFEVNTGAIARGLRTTPYPAENLLYILKNDNRIYMFCQMHIYQSLLLSLVFSCLMHRIRQA